MLVLEPVTSFVPRVSHFHSHPHFNFNFKLEGRKRFFLLARDHCSLFSGSGIIIMTLLLVAWAIIWLWQMTNENDDSTLHLAFDNYNRALLPVLSFLWCGVCHNYILSLAFIQWAAIRRTHTLFLPPSLSLWLVGSAKKKCREECGMRWRVLQGWFLIFWFFVSFLQEEVHEQELWCLSQTLSTNNWPWGKWVIGCVFVKAFFWMRLWENECGDGRGGEGKVWM